MRSVAMAEFWMGDGLHLSATKLEIKPNDEGNMLFKVAKIGRVYPVYPGGC